MDSGEKMIKSLENIIKKIKDKAIIKFPTNKFYATTN